MKQKNYQRWSRPLLLTLLSIFMAFSGASSAWADELTVYNSTGESTYYPVHGNYADTNNSLSEYIIPSTAISAMNGATISKMTFYISSVAAAQWTSTFTVYMKEIANTVYESSSAIGDGGATVVYTGLLDGTGSTMDVNFTNNYDYNGGNLLIGFKVTSATSVWKSATFVGETQSGYTSFRNKNSATREKFLPKTTFTYSAAAVEGSAFVVKDGSTKLSSPYAYNFGLATAGTTKTFKLTNPGTAATPISVDVSGANGFTAAVEDNATSIPAGGEKTLTITMPNATASGSVVVTPTGDGLSAFTFNVSGTYRDANKVYETLGSGSIPEDWSQTSWSFATGYAYTNAWSQTSNARLITPKLDIKSGEKIMFEAIGTYSDDPSYQTMVVEYSSDKSAWTASETAITLTSDWQSIVIDDIPVGSYYIAIHASQARVRNYYGGELPKVAKMTVTEPATLDFGLYDKDASPAPMKTFTIANTGTATLNGISVTSGNAAFTITGAPTSLAAGASETVTITMSTATAGALSSLITVSATDMADASFTVTGQVLPSGLSVIDFNDNQLPARWENTGWTFSNGAAYASYHSPAYIMTTPKIEMGDFLVVKGKIEYNSSSYYVTVKGLDANDDEVYSKKLTNDVFNNEEYKYAILSDIPTTVKKLQFVGYYGYIDEIQGINYAAALVVTTGAPAATVNTPAAYDFGECAANATVTYNFANAGAGTINITNVAITGAGAAAYSTNWTESVAAPFDLTITRTYDAGRASAGAQEAVVTVTTSEGNFVINVTGTDMAANAPTLSVSTNAIDFGKVTANAVQTVTVTNTGTGTMAVDIASDSEDFEVSTASLTGIGAGLSKTFNITFKYGTPYGVKNGNVTVTPTYDVGAAQVITVTGKAKDPATWSEDFSGGELPTGWDAGANWTIADGAAKGTWNSSASYLTTAPLTVSATTDELTFDYITTAGNVSIVIQKSKDGGEWTTCTATPAIPTYMSNGTAGTATITGLEAGSYQFRFKNDDYNLDNFEGFVLNLPDHMATITGSSIPESPSWDITMKQGKSFDATVTVKEQRGVAEELTAKLYMGEEVIGTKVGSVSAKGTETLTITCTPTVAAPEGAQMHIEVEWAGTKMTTDNVTRYVAALNNLTLNEESSDAIVAGTYDNLTLVRKFTAGWNTVCLPFTISDVEAFFGSGAKAYDFTSYSEGTLGFTSENNLTASYPYVVYVPAAINDDFELHDITIAAGDATAFHSYQSGAYFRGTYTPIAAGGWTKNADGDKLYGVTAAGKIAKIGDTATSKGFRGYFDLPAGATARLSFFDETTGITTVMDAKELNNDGKVYNLNGQRVENAHKGLYIVNGRKVVVK